MIIGWVLVHRLLLLKHLLLGHRPLGASTSWPSSSACGTSTTLSIYVSLLLLVVHARVLILKELLVLLELLEHLHLFRAHLGLS
jgi:hypothetical protein